MEHNAHVIKKQEIKERIRILDEELSARIEYRNNRQKEEYSFEVFVNHDDEIVTFKRA